MKRYCIDCQHYNEGGVCGKTKQMVDLLREHGWTVTCEKYEKLEL